MQIDGRRIEVVLLGVFPDESHLEEVALTALYLTEPDILTGASLVKLLNEYIRVN